MKKIYISAAVLALGLVGSNSFAATANKDFQVKIKVAAGCIFDAEGISDLNFGEAEPFTTVIGQTEFSLKCTDGTAATIALQPGEQGFKMTNSAAKTIEYALYSDPARAQTWDKNNTVVHNGSGVAQTYTVYGKVENTGAVIGDFSDTVTVEVTY